MNTESLASVLRAVLTDAAGEVLNARGAARGCGPLYWFVPVPGFDSTWSATRRPVGAARFPDERVSVLTGYPDAGHTDEQALAAVRAWAKAFGLEPDQNAAAHTVAYLGEIEDVLVEVWAIADRAGFYGRDEG